MTKPLIAVITDKPTQQSRMFFWVKEAVAEEQPIVFTTPLEKTTISSLTTIINSELKKFPFDSADYRAMLLKEEISKPKTRNAEADLTVADLFDATNKEVENVANSDNQINAVNALPKDETSSNIQTAAEALAGIDGYMVAGGSQCGQNSDSTCWIRYNFKKSLVYMKKLKDNGESIQDGLPVDGEQDVINELFRYGPNNDGTVTVRDFKSGASRGNAGLLKLKTIGFDIFTVETVKLNGETFKANPKYIGKHSKEVKFTNDKAEMYIVKAHSPEEPFNESDDDIRAGKKTIEITNDQNQKETKTIWECGSDVRCEDDATFPGKENADPQIFKGKKFEIVMRTSGDYYAIAKNDPTEEFYYSGNMGPFAKKRDYRRGRWEKTDTGSYVFYGEGGVPVFKIVDCSKGNNSNNATTATAASTENASNSGDNNMSCSSGYRAAGHIALANYDSFVFFNIDAAKTIQETWEKTETTSQE